MGAAAQMLCGGAMMLFAGLLLGERLDAMPTTKGLFAVAYLAGFRSIIAFSAYVWLLHHVRPTLAGSYAYVTPVVAVVLGAWLAAERFRGHSMGALGGILPRVVTTQRSKAPARKVEPSAEGSH